MNAFAKLPSERGTSPSSYFHFGTISTDTVPSLWISRRRAAAKPPEYPCDHSYLKLELKKRT